MELVAILVGAFVGGSIIKAFKKQSADGVKLKKSKRHEVEFIKGKPIVLVPEKDYINMQVELAKLRKRAYKDGRN